LVVVTYDLRMLLTIDLTHHDRYHPHLHLVVDRTLLPELVA
jgi:hypothetical protein